MIQVNLIEDKNIWENYLLNQKPNVFLQSWNWGEFQKKLGRKIFRLGFWHNNQLSGISLIVREDAKRGRYLTCPGGPILNWQKKELFGEFVKCLHRIGKTDKAVFARVRPTILATKENNRLFKSVGFINAPMHMHAETTWQLDIRSSEDDLLRGMRKTTRQSIKKAINAGVKIDLTQDLKKVEILYQLQQETAERHKFVPFSQEHLKEQFQIFATENQCLLFLANYQGRILAISMIIYYGDTAVYHYSGSSNAFAHIPASSLIQWEAIREAKRRGCSIYNFWGIAPSDNSHHRFAGVTTFKKGFGGQKVDYLHAQDLPFKTRYWLVYAFENTRRIFRRL